MTKEDLIYNFNNAIYSEYETLNKIIEEAIKYIKDNTNYEDKQCNDGLNCYECEELLEILGGEENGM